MTEDAQNRRKERAHTYKSSQTNEVENTNSGLHNKTRATGVLWSYLHTWIAKRLW